MTQCQGQHIKKDRLIDENQTEEKKLFLCMRMSDFSVALFQLKMYLCKWKVSMGREGEEDADIWQATSLCFFSRCAISTMGSSAAIFQGAGLTRWLKHSLSSSDHIQCNLLSFHGLFPVCQQNKTKMELHHSHMVGFFSLSINKTRFMEDQDSSNYS